jgi:hypothetical protein
VIDILTMQNTGRNFIIISFSVTFLLLKSLVIGQMHLEHMQVHFSTGGNCSYSFHSNSQIKVDAQCSDNSCEKWYG